MALRAGRFEFRSDGSESHPYLFSLALGQA